MGTAVCKEGNCDRVPYVCVPGEGAEVQNCEEKTLCYSMCFDRRSAACMYYDSEDVEGTGCHCGDPRSRARTVGDSRRKEIDLKSILPDIPSLTRERDQVLFNCDAETVSFFLECFASSSDYFEILSDGISIFRRQVNDPKKSEYYAVEHFGLPTFIEIKGTDLSLVSEMIVDRKSVFPCKECPDHLVYCNVIEISALKLGYTAQMDIYVNGCRAPDGTDLELSDCGYARIPVGPMGVFVEDILIKITIDGGESDGYDGCGYDVEYVTFGSYDALPTAMWCETNEPASDGKWNTSGWILLKPYQKLRKYGG